MGARAPWEFTVAMHAQRLCRAVLEMSKQHGWICSLPHDLTNPSLMTGLSGIGYGRMRSAAPNRVPSVLTSQDAGSYEPEACAGQHQGYKSQSSV